VKLEGSLDAFSLPDIFQLLSFTKKSGGLHLRRGNQHGCVYFAEGAITGALADNGRQSLARRLIGAAEVPISVLEQAVERARSEGVGVGRALLDAGAVDDALLRSVVTDQAVDAVFDFLRWSDGEFSFGLDEVSPDDVGVRLATDEVIAEARSRLDVWERACRIIPSPQTVLAVPVCIGEEPRLSRAEWALLALVDGRRSVAELVQLAGRGDFAVVSTLAGLVERRLLVVRGGEDDGGVDGLIRRHELLSRLDGGASADRGAGGSAGGPEAARISEQRTASAEPDTGGDSDRASTPSSPGGTTAASPAAAAVGTAASACEPAVDPALAFDPESADLPAASTVASVLAAAKPDAGPRLIPDTRQPVVPPRPEPFLPPRRPAYPEEPPEPRVVGTAAALASPASEPRPRIERDPSVNKSLLLRLIAGVRGL
jgi:hypothetical protein